MIDKKKDIFFIFLSGYTIIGSIALVLHFFFPLSNTLSTIIISIGLLILLFKKISFKKIYLYYFIFFLFVGYLLLGASEHAIDSNMYHHPYVSYIKTEKIIFGITNLHSRFGHISFLQYAQSIFVNDFFSKFLISFINIIFFGTFIVYCFEIVISERKNKVLIIFAVFISCYTLIKFGRYREFGNDLIPFLISNYLLLIIIKNFSNKKNRNENISYYFPFYVFLTVTHKISYVFSSIIFITIINFKNLDKFFKNKIIFFPIILLLVWFLKNYIETSCIIYPISTLCFENISWSLFGLSDSTYAMTSAEAWSKGWIDKPKNFQISMKDFNSSFNWVNIWFDKHFIKILEKVSPLIILILIVKIYFLFFNENKPISHFDKYNIRNRLIKLLVLILIGLTVWFLKSPLFRYGAFYIIASLILVFLIFDLKSIEKISYIKLRNLKYLIFISFVFFVFKNLDRQFKVNYFSFPLTELSDKNYIIVNKEYNLVKPKKNMIVCYYSNYICSHMLPENFNLIEKNNYLFIEK